MVRSDVTILIAAAGGSTRMRGGDKLLEQVGGIPLLRRQGLAARASGARVVVTLPPDRPARAEVLEGLGAEVAVLADAAEGMAASLRHGARVAGGALMVLPADMPEIDMADLRSMLAAHKAAPDAILRGASDGAPGHPVLFPADLRADLAQLTGDEGARSVLARHRGRVQLVPLPGRHALTDLDTPEDWAAWRAAR
ncbi:nucleotidyltransferase family protein [Gemmobacter sp.]|uniref:nucleotidyltransferase family protein n=1 Tax=Gemmobacter sp. TaxID=1898957 RepID=UPI002AFE4C34|nr:nucleotidyltransferase family protein [Gemmobacter sp.]